MSALRLQESMKMKATEQTLHQLRGERGGS